MKLKICKEEIMKFAAIGDNAWFVLPESPALENTCHIFTRRGNNVYTLESLVQCYRCEAQEGRATLVVPCIEKYWSFYGTIDPDATCFYLPMSVFQKLLVNSIDHFEKTT